MPSEYTVSEGDCIDSIAAENGFLPATLWNHPDNAALKELRADPNVLMPGDIVMIPDLELREESAASEQRHRYKRKGVPARLRLRLMQPVEPEPSTEDDSSDSTTDEQYLSSYEDVVREAPSRETEPRSNVPLIVEIDGVRGPQEETDGDGRIEVSLPPGARRARLILNPGTAEEEIIPLQLGGIDPVATMSGARKRLRNLGYMCSLQGDELTPELREVIMQVQRENSLEVTGQMDTTTQDKLVELHGC